MSQEKNYFQLFPLFTAVMTLLKILSSGQTFTDTVKFIEWRYFYGNHKRIETGIICT